MNTFNITLDLNKSKVTTPIRLRQGDLDGTTITALILDHGATADLTGLAARFVMELPGGEHYYRKDATVGEGSVTVTINEEHAASVTGRTTRAYFQLLNGETVRASTGSVTVDILPDALEGHTVPADYDSAIQNAIDALDDAVENIADTVEDVLEDHPEWTTTVQDGAVTDAKLYQGKDGILARNARLMYRLDNLLTNALPEGDSATASDAAKTPVAGLALYGRSTQDGTPTPSAPVPIVSVGTANLYQQTVYAAGATYTTAGLTVTHNADGTCTVSGTATGNAWLWGGGSSAVAGYYVTLPAGTYTVCGSHSVAAQKMVGSTVSSLVGQTAGSATFTLTEETLVKAVPIIPSGTTVSGDTAWVAVYAGSTACPYVPYGYAGLWAKRTSDESDYTVTPVPLDGHELRSLPDGTRDELRVDERGHAVLVQRVGSVDLGTLTWTPISSSGTSKKRMCSSGVKSSISPTPGGAVPNVMCERYQPKKNTDVYKLVTGVNIASDGDIVIYDPDYNTNDSASAFAAAVSGVALIYPLATPQTIDLGTIDPVPLCGPDLTAQAVPAAPFALAYERDLNVTLARLEAAIAALA